MVNCYLLHSHTVNFRKKAPPPPNEVKFVRCTLNKLKLTFVPRATLSHFTVSRFLFCFKKWGLLLNGELLSAAFAYCKFPEKSLPPERSKARSLYSEQVETDLCAACHAFTLHGFSLFVLFLKTGASFKW